MTLPRVAGCSDVDFCSACTGVNQLPLLTHGVRFFLTPVFVALLLVSSLSPVFAQSELDTLFAKLRDPKVGSNVLRIEPQIWSEWMAGGTPEENEALIKATASMNLADFAGAEKQLNAILEKTQTFPEVWNKRATLYFLMGRFDESLADIVKTLDLEPRHFGALSGRGMIYQRLGKEAQAIEAFKDALSIHPNLLGAKISLQQLEKSSPEL
jgi:tetratricopeptide (TPR) repeat protein